MPTIRGPDERPCGDARPGAYFCTGPDSNALRNGREDLGGPAQGQMASDRIVVVTFIELVGSSALANRFPSGAADELRRKQLSTLRELIASNDGSTVMSFGDALMTVSTSIGASVTGAVQMQQAVRENNDAHGVAGLAIPVRIGMSAGDASVHGGHANGDVVREAARLCAKADAGEILVSQALRAVYRRRSYRFQRIGLLEVGPRVEPVEGFALVWDPPTAHEPGRGVPLQWQLSRRPEIGKVVGREPELHRLVTSYERVAEGLGHEAVFISGEAGAGKTTLAAELARRAHEIGACVLVGRFDEALTLPYRPFFEGLDHLIEHSDPEALCPLMGPDIEELATVMPSLRRMVDPSETANEAHPEARRHLRYGGIVRLLESISSATPLVFVLDDIQWADAESLQLVHHLLRSTWSAHLFLVGLYRGGEVTRSHPLNQLLGALQREPCANMMELCNFDEDDVLALIEAATHHHGDAVAMKLARRVRWHTGGNPFFVTEVVRHLFESGAVNVDDDGHLWLRGRSDSIALPDSVSQVINARVARLGDRVAEALFVASVIGPEFDLDLLSRACETSEAELLEILERAVSERLLDEVSEPPWRFRFATELVQHSLSQELGPARRGLAHRKVALALDVEEGTVPKERIGELARHWSSTGQPTDIPRAIDLCAQAGEAALSGLAPAEAVDWYERAIEMNHRIEAPDTRRTIDLSVGLGRAQRQAGMERFGETLCQAARLADASGDPGRLVTASLEASLGAIPADLWRVNPEKVDILESALAVSPQGSPSRARVLAALCNELSFGSTVEHRQELADEALAIARPLDDPSTLVDVSIRLAFPLDLPETRVIRLEATTETLQLADKMDDPVARYWSYMNHSFAALQAGRRADADRSVAAMVSLSDGLGQPWLRWISGFRQALSAVLDGDHAAAERFAMEPLWARRAGQTYHPLTLYGAQLTGIRWQQGRLAEILPAMIDVATGFQLPVFTAAVALAYSDLDRPRDAEALLDRAAGRGFSSMPRDASWVTALNFYSEVAVRTNARSIAGQLYELLRPYHAHYDANIVAFSGPVAHFTAGLASVLERYEEAEELYRLAVEVNGRVGATFMNACTELSWGQMYLRRGTGHDPERARHHLHEARGTAVLRGYPIIERHATIALSSID